MTYDQEEMKQISRKGMELKARMKEAESTEDAQAKQQCMREYLDLQMQAVRLVRAGHA